MEIIGYTGNRYGESYNIIKTHLDETGREYKLAHFTSAKKLIKALESNKITMAFLRLSNSLDGVFYDAEKVLYGRDYSIEWSKIIDNNYVLSFSGSTLKEIHLDPLAYNTIKESLVQMFPEVKIKIIKDINLSSGTDSIGIICRETQANSLNLKIVSPIKNNKNSKTKYELLSNINEKYENLWLSIFLLPTTMSKSMGVISLILYILIFVFAPEQKLNFLPLILGVLGNLSYFKNLFVYHKIKGYWIYSLAGINETNLFELDHIAKISFNYKTGDINIKGWREGSLGTTFEATQIFVDYENKKLNLYYHYEGLSLEKSQFSFGYTIMKPINYTFNRKINLLKGKFITKKDSVNKVNHGLIEYRRISKERFYAIKDGNEYFKKE